MKSDSEKPLIAITCCSMVGESWARSSQGTPMDYVYRDYSRCVEAVGGLPVLLPIVDSHETLKATIKMVHGLILSGGPDICPRLYGEDSIVGIGEIDHALDVMQLEAVREADKKRIPTLGICRGIQAITVAFGGTLYQDIPAQVESNLDHMQKVEQGVNTHRVTITNPSKLFEIVGTETLWVNSRHHQAVRTLPPDLVATAKSSDGVIEAIEKPDHPFLLGVQWHPEGTCAQDEASQKLFAALVTAAKESPGLSER